MRECILTRSCRSEQIWKIDVNHVFITGWMCGKVAANDRKFPHHTHWHHYYSRHSRCRTATLLPLRIFANSSRDSLGREFAPDWRNYRRKMATRYLGVDASRCAGDISPKYEARYKLLSELNLQVRSTGMLLGSHQ